LCADTEGIPHAVSGEPPQVQTEGHIADVEGMDSALCGLASDVGCSQSGSESLDEGVMDDTTNAAISNSNTDWSLNSTTQGKYSNKQWCLIH